MNYRPTTAELSEVKELISQQPSYRDSGYLYVLMMKVAGILGTEKVVEALTGKVREEESSQNITWVSGLARPNIFVAYTQEDHPVYGHSSASLVTVAHRLISQGIYCQVRPASEWFILGAPVHTTFGRYRSNYTVIPLGTRLKSELTPEGLAEYVERKSEYAVAVDDLGKIDAEEINNFINATQLAREGLNQSFLRTEELQAETESLLASLG